MASSPGTDAYQGVSQQAERGVFHSNNHGVLGVPKDRKESISRSLLAQLAGARSVDGVCCYRQTTARSHRVHEDRGWHLLPV